MLVLMDAICNAKYEWQNNAFGFPTPLKDGLWWWIRIGSDKVLFITSTTIQNMCNKKNVKSSYIPKTFKNWNVVWTSNPLIQDNIYKSHHWKWGIQLISFYFFEIHIFTYFIVFKKWTCNLCKKPKIDPKNYWLSKNN